MLETEGFAFEGYVDIFDGGPTMIARTDQVRSVADAAGRKVSSIDLEEGERALLATGSLSDFRCCYGARAIDEDGSIVIDSHAADLLRVTAGDTVWSVPR